MTTDPTTPAGPSQAAIIGTILGASGGASQAGCTEPEIDQAIDDAVARVMTTDPTTQAVRTVARRVLVHIVAATEVSQKWEDYPDIGQDDWQVVAAEVRHLAERADVQTEHYDSAYRHLASRAEGDAA